MIFLNFKYQAYIKLTNSRPADAHWQHVKKMNVGNYRSRILSGLLVHVYNITYQNCSDYYISCSKQEISLL